MDCRTKRKLQAEKYIYEPLRNILLSKYGKFSPNVEVLIRRKNSYLVLVDKNDSFRVPNITKNEFENMLNLLQQFDLVKCESYLSGDVFKVRIIDFKEINHQKCKIIPIRRYKKAI